MSFDLTNPKRRKENVSIKNSTSKYGKFKISDLDF